MKGADLDARTARIPPNLLQTFNIWGAFHALQFTGVITVNIPQQTGVECGIMVNELARRLVSNESLTDFQVDEVVLRASQMKLIYDYLTAQYFQV